MDMYLVDTDGWREATPSLSVANWSGIVYIGNLTAPWHQVRHDGVEVPGELLRTSAGDELEFAVMLRADVFGGCYGRAAKTPPGLAAVYRAANSAVAAHLAEAVLQLPSLASCLAEYDYLQSA